MRPRHNEFSRTFHNSHAQIRPALNRNIMQGQTTAYSMTNSAEALSSVVLFKDESVGEESDTAEVLFPEH